MSSKVIRVSTPSGAPILISIREVEEVPSATPTPNAKMPLIGASKIEEVGKTVGEVCSTLYEHVSGAMQHAKPDKVVIRFGVTLTGQAGIPLITEGTAEASFRIQATWHTRSENGKTDK